MLHDVHIRSRGYLPHWEREGGTYFVTFRLAGTLPQSVVQEWKGERERLIAQYAIVHAKVAPASGRQIAGRMPAFALRALPPAVAMQFQKLFSEKVDAYLDAGYGDRWLAQSPIAQLVQNALRHFEGERYELLAWCLMPNHVHCVFTPLGDYKLDSILHSWKSYTALQANRLLNRAGKPFWQKESYDHLIRDEEDLLHCVTYTEANPVKAGLCARAEEWQWCSAYQQRT
jgi:REP element-mobilizing transposase RayT